jgi:hypothetical protein
MSAFGGGRGGKPMEDPPSLSLLPKKGKVR